MAEPIRGHRLVPHTADCIIEAWGPDRASCAAEALSGLVGSFAQVTDPSVAEEWPLGTKASEAGDALVSLLEDVIYAVEVLGVVPVRFHLREEGQGQISGDMEVVTSDRAEVVGPVPKAVSYHDLSMAAAPAGWRCRVLVDV